MLVRVLRAPQAEETAIVDARRDTLAADATAGLCGSRALRRRLAPPPRAAARAAARIAPRVRRPRIAARIAVRIAASNGEKIRKLDSEKKSGIVTVDCGVNSYLRDHQRGPDEPTTAAAIILLFSGEL